MYVMKEFLLTVLQSIIIAAVPVITAYACKFLNTKASALAQTMKNEEAKKFLEDAVEAVNIAVVSTNQTYVESLKKSGEFSLENQKEAFKISYDTAVAVMTQEAKEFIEKAYGGLEGWLSTQIEATVNANK